MKNIHLIFLIFSILALAAAYTAEYGFGLRPCTLCLYQRIPYAVVIVLGLLSVFCPTWARGLLWAMTLTFATGAALAAFHVGVEQGWWPGLASCGGSLPTDLSVETLRDMPVVRCDRPAWTLFGVSMAGYNALLSFVLTVAAVRVAIRPSA